MKLHISAGGMGTRISDYINSNYDSNIPKHLLPLPNKLTLLDEVVKNALVFFDSVTIWVNSSNFELISSSMENYKSIEVKIDKEMTGPLGPVIREVLSCREVSFGCAGDFYCDFSWKNFYKFHQQSESSISILTTKSVSTHKGARFHLSGRVIESWERVDITTAQDFINIGCYIINPDAKVFSDLTNLVKHKEDEFFDIFIPKRVISGYNPGSLGFNVNTPDVYKHLVDYLS